SSFSASNENSEKLYIIPPSRVRYLSEISENNRNYDKQAAEQVEIAQKLYGIYKTIESVSNVISSETKPSFLDKHGLNSDEILRQAQNDKSGVIPMEGGTTDEESREQLLKLL